MKTFLVVCGSLAVVLGTVGIVVPLLPSTPLYLLAAFCFARSSNKFYEKLMSNPMIGKRIRNYRDKRGMPLREKVITLLLLWISIGTTWVFFVSGSAVRILLLVIASAVTVHILLLNTLKN
ncbi:MAG: DUF454 family protein [Candidatus Aegiribacteria sp.]|nr:DUF454 family protein [Candidatus Aegiribacteria sp.]MBD3294828.1 DUF454 family protein [Candidatus Fermentibacteria bacterium]